MRLKLNVGDAMYIRMADNRDRRQIWDLIFPILSSYGLTMDAETIDHDLTDIEANYWRQQGAFYVLMHGAQLIGTVALHRASETVCELRRMYLAADYRGKGLGRELLQFALQQAEARGFSEVVLKTASVLKEALALYRRAGFIPVADQGPGGNCDVVMSRKISG
ncbi:MAG TPA: GNAT family N-acetyltransferase [bacterium]|mgnify:CR=1 FL=1|nr:GNAT family N-acetyltransferase [bacterium]HPN34869.1 GNAT family N-acetyltransferase [bacterium]